MVNLVLLIWLQAVLMLLNCKGINACNFLFIIFLLIQGANVQLIFKNQMFV